MRPQERIEIRLLVCQRCGTSYERDAVTEHLTICWACGAPRPRLGARQRPAALSRGAMLHYSSERRMLLVHSVWADALALLVVLAAAVGVAYLVGASPPRTWEGAAQVLAQLRGALGLG